MLKAKYVGSYVSKRGNRVFKYDVIGSEAEIEQYKETQTKVVENKETGNPFFFSTKYFGETGDLTITVNGMVVPDMDNFNKAASLAAQFGGNFGQSIADAAAQQLIGQLGIGRGASATSKSSPVHTEEKKEEQINAPVVDEKEIDLGNLG